MADARRPWIERLTARVKDLFGGPEGSWRGPFFATGHLGHLFPLGRIEDGFQRGLAIGGYEGRLIPAAYAAVLSNARAVSQCYAAHKHVDEKGNVTTVTTSAASRVLRKPNAAETWPQFILNMVAALQFEGAAYAVAMRNARGEVVALWRMPHGSCAPYVAEDGTIFYALGDNPLAPDLPIVDTTSGMARATDVLHLRTYCPRHPLIGETPLASAAMAAGINVTLQRSQLSFFSQMRRPSGALSTDMAMTTDKMRELRTAFDEQAARLENGGMPILSNGLKFAPFAISSVDAQLIEAQRLSIEDIARVFGVPLPVIGDLTHATLTNVEALVNQWLAVSLGALLENIERSLDALFGLQSPSDYVELDVRALLRSDFAGRIDATCKAIQGGLMTPNEARSREGLSPVPFGDQPYLQAQMVPMGTEPKPAGVPAPAPAAGAPPASGDGNASDGSPPNAGASGDDGSAAKALMAARAAILRAAIVQTCEARS
jgi:HK97 family phage portal protein